MAETVVAAETVKLTGSCTGFPPLGVSRIDPVYAPTLNPAGLTPTVTGSGVFPLAGVTVNQVVFGVVMLTDTGEDPDALVMLIVCVGGAVPVWVVKTSDGLSDVMLPVFPVGTV